ncbi:McrB family protein [Deinococcus ruber]|uniref:Type IV methyl-directed restriction enzyme EcoKMcrB subunit DNA-binding domain-containing protein n=1 Tax=Deinococcus ruber TaxID=1848197 RepID=A0A918C915_9DEIO|nr:DUF3578 domain-containing protein [Deinococcus ruber]GGR11229.1 hypothetical protein GCM10008957_24910 [Deinococcus ruber]
MTSPSPSPLRDYLNYTLEHYSTKGTFRDDRGRFVEAATAAQEALQQQPALQAAAAVQEIKSSFGKGNWANCPWTAILDPRETRTTQTGVYIVWLFRADMSGVYLTLAQGVTEVQKAHKGESFEVLRAEAEKVRAVTGALSEQGFSSDPISLRSSTYGKAYEASVILQKFYPREALPPERALLEDVEVLFQAYSTYLGQKGPASANDALRPTSITQDLQQAFGRRGLTYTNEQIEMFFTALQTKGFVIISGISGTGKSKIAQAFADLCQTGHPSVPGPSRVLFLPVKPDWRDNKSLLGYYNPLSETYHRPAFLELLGGALDDYEANGRQAAPWFVILDEMNLAHVEHYFSDVLSVLESGRDVEGLTVEAVVLEAPEGVMPRRRFPLPPNLYIVGTVNLDETTHVFSPKVLDRAFSLEFTDVDFTHYPPKASGAATLDAHTLRAFTSDGQFAQIQKASVAAALTHHPEVRAALQALTSLLRPHLLHFGYQVFDEIVLFHAHARRSGMLAEPGVALDAAVSMKVLPKFHGGRAKLWAALVKVLCWSADPQQPHLALEQLNSILAGRALEDASLHDLRKILLDEPQAPMTSARALRMLEDLERDGFTAFG